MGEATSISPIYGNNRVLKEMPSGGNFATVNVEDHEFVGDHIDLHLRHWGHAGRHGRADAGSAAGLDFADARTGSCTNGTNNATGTSYLYNAGDTCTVDVTFTPQFAGNRYGAAVLKDSSGNVIATGYVQGTGVGPQVNFLPGAQSIAASGLDQPSGIAVDGSGNVYIADSGNNRVVEETLAAGIYTQSTLATSSLSSPFGIAADAIGNVYIADTYNQRVLLETFLAGSGSYSESTLVTDSLLYPYGIAVDAGGNVYIADPVNGLVMKETLSGGGYVQNTLATGNLSSPSGVAVDAYGNVYIADTNNNRVLKEDFWDPPSLSFASTSLGTTSSDSPRKVTVENIGNGPLSFPSLTSGNNPSITTNFTLNSSSPFACPLVASGSAAGTLPAGESCLLSISFTPTGAGSISGALVLADNNLNVPEPGYATQSITLSGAPETPVITWATPAAITYGTALSATQLNASSNVAGTFVYSPLAGTTPAAGTQTLSVTFTPTDATDYATATKTVSLTVQDFSLPSTPPAVAVTAGQTGVASFTVSPVSGLAGTVSFTCSVPSNMSEASCSATSVQISASAGASSTLTVTTTGSHYVTLKTRPGRWVASGIGAVFAGFILLGVPKVKRRRASLLVLFTLLLLSLGMMSCGGNSGTSSGSTGGKQMDTATPAGTYSLTLTATSGTASHTMNVPVTVQ